MLDFEILFPRDEEELFEVLNSDSRILNGGTDVMVRARLERFPVAKLVSLDKIEDLTGIVDEGNAIRILCKTTYSEILNHPVIRENFPILLKACSEIGSTQIRNRGTLAGNVANASPAGDGSLALYLLDALVVIHHRNGQKTIRLEDFIKGPGRTLLEPGEYIHSIIIPKLTENTVHYFKKVGQRKAMAISIASMGAVYSLRKGMFMNLRLAFGSLGPTVLRADSIEAAARGMKFDEATAEKLSAMTAAVVSPIGDVRASAEYRGKVASNLVIGLFNL
ncbi:MAG TPA: xanthine dehydrogenase family protein subunit M [Thermotogota bacterium]|nr:xanthine dehydrogenase family protein subunit M [Thermotogota bacterium]HPR97033.1 xanthine dehydrogenase family protein subunit M [Thermotogota bacterium]